MSHRFVLLTLLTAGAIAPAAEAVAQHETAQTVRGYGTLSDLHGAFRIAAAERTPEARELATDRIWKTLERAGRIPFVDGDSAAFLWRGEAGRLNVAGDFNGWHPDETRLLRLGESDVWFGTISLPRDARVDYKLVVDGLDWRLDEANPHQQWGGAGPNSELRMPDWTVAPETVVNEESPVGSLSLPDTLQSVRYGAPVVFRVYEPAGIDDADSLSVVYVTDGHEYADQRLGALPTILDNLIASGRVEPVLAVFIDPRWDEENRRQAQYVGNRGFMDFVALELVPEIDSRYNTRQTSDARIILGTSLGGLFSASLGLAHPTVFRRLAIQSPSFWLTDTDAWRDAGNADLFEQFRRLDPDSFVVAMSTGNIHDTEDGARRMRGAMTVSDQVLSYSEVAQGHSWGNWRGRLPEMLVHLLGHGMDQAP